MGSWLAHHVSTLWSRLQRCHPPRPGRDRWYDQSLAVLALLGSALLHLALAGIIWVGVAFFAIFLITIDQQRLAEIPAPGDQEPPPTQRTGRAGTTGSAFDALNDQLLKKYVITLGVVVGVTLLGSLARLKVMKRNKQISWQHIQDWIPDVAKTGIFCGGLAFGALAAVIAIFQATVTDEQKLPAGSLLAEQIVWLAFATAYLAVLAGYLAVKDQIMKTPGAVRSGPPSDNSGTSTDA